MENISARTIVLFITGILVAAVLGLFVTLRSSTNSMTQIMDLEQLAQTMLLSYQNVGYNYGSGTIPSTTLIATGKIPSGMILGTGSTATLNSRWNTAIAVSGNTNSYTVQLTSIPTGNCIDILTDPGLAQFVTSYQAGASGGGTVLQPPVPLATAAGTGGCAAGTNTISIIFSGSP